MLPRLWEFILTGTALAVLASGLAFGGSYQEDSTPTPEPAPEQPPVDTPTPPPTPAPSPTQANAITLPKPQYDSEVSLEQSLLERRSIRKYTGEPVTLQELSQLSRS